MRQIIERIKNHELGNYAEAMAIYVEFCEGLKKKYGLVNKDYDENPKKRGAEWLDIHHIMEYELDDIAERTKWAMRAKKPPKLAGIGVTLTVSKEDYENEEKRKEWDDKYGKQGLAIFVCDDTLERL